MSADVGLDESKLTLTEHLTELRSRLLRSMIAIVLTTSVCAIFSPEILKYASEPLGEVLRDRNRVETLLVHHDKQAGPVLAERLDKSEKVIFHGLLSELSQVTEKVQSQKAKNRPIDMVLVSSEAIGSDGALVSDLLEGVEPAPYVAYLVSDRKDPAIFELQLEGALVLLEPMRDAVLKRTVRRAAAAAGKAAQGDKLVFLSPIEPFFAYLKIALVCGLFLACPVWIFQIWQFVAPGLYAHEKKVVIPAVGSASLLFIGGGLFAYYAMFPIMFDVLVNQMMPPSMAASFTVDKYLALLLRVTLAFGAVFELPLVLALLSAMGIVTSAGLKRWRKYAIVIAFIVSAFLTPADPLSQVMMALPLVVFYELGIILSMILGRKRAQSSALAKVDGLDD